MRRVVTLTPNPSLDRTLEVDALVRGAVLRAAATRLDPGGKGVNVSRALAANGIETTAILPTGGSEGRQLTQLLACRGVDVKSVEMAGTVRINITVAEPDGTVTKVNEPGPELSECEVETLLDACRVVAERADWLVGCGSLPLGAPEDFYGRLASRCHRGTRVGVDSSGAALLAAIDAGVDLVKPNLGELAEIAGEPLLTLGAAVDAALQVRSRGVTTVLASLGPDGAILVTAAGVLHGTARIDALRSTVGAGDALFAGYLSVADGDAARSLATALAWGSAAASLPGSRMPGPADIAGIPVTIHDGIDRGRPLTQEPT